MSDTTSAVNAGDTAWLLTSAALVMLMTPALGFFYGGLVRRKNVLSTLMHSWFILALISSSGCSGATRWHSALTPASD